MASALPPVIFNGLIIGAELCWCIMGQWNWGVFIAQGVSVAAGEAVITVRCASKPSICTQVKVTVAAK